MLLLLVITVAWALLLGLFALLMLRTDGALIRTGKVASFYRQIWQISGRISRPAMCMIAIGVAAIVLRLLALPFLPVPEPRVHDEFSYLLAGETFASGRLTNAQHMLWPFFEFEHILVRPTYMSKYPPAQGLLLALGLLLGHSWIAVLISYGLMCAAIFWMARAFQPTRWAILAALLPLIHPGIASYWCNSYWGGTVAATAAALVFGACVRLARVYSVRAGLLLTAGLIILLNSRPFEGLVAVVVPVGCLVYSLGKKSSSIGVKTVLKRLVTPLCLMFIALASMLYYNRCVTGDALQLPYQCYHRQYSRIPLWLLAPTNSQTLTFNNIQLQAFAIGEALKFNKLRTVPGWLDCLINERLVAAFNFFVGIWFVPLVAASLFSLPDKRVRVLWLSVTALTAAVSCEVYFQRHYLAPVVAPFYVLLVQGLRHLRLLKINKIPLGLAFSHLILAIMLIGFLYGLIALPDIGRKNIADLQVFPGPRQKVMTALLKLPGKHLVIVRYARGHDTGAEYVYNSADIDHSQVVWARDLGESKNRQVLAYYQDRKVWLFEPDVLPPLLSEFEAASLAR